MTRRVSLLVLLLIVVTTGAACSHANVKPPVPSLRPSAAPTERVWRWMSHGALERTTHLWKNLYLRQDVDTGEILVSHDGRTWDFAGLGSFLTERSVDFAFNDTAVYILGTSTRSGFPGVWESLDGQTWTGPSTIEDASLSAVALAVSDDALMVAGLGNRNTVDGPGDGLHLWTRRTEAGPWQRRTGVPSLGDWVPPPAGGLVHLASGFFLLGGDVGRGCDLYDFGPGQIWGREDCSYVYRSVDGSSWQDISAARGGGRIGIPYALSQSGNRLVLWGRAKTERLGDVPGGPLYNTKLAAWYADAGDPVWQSATVDAGTVPDLGARPLAQQDVTDLAATPLGFVAVGSSGESETVGAVWTSGDGVSWKKEPTKANGFDKFASMRLPSPSVALVCGYADEGRQSCWAGN